MAAKKKPDLQRILRRAEAIYLRKRGNRGVAAPATRKGAPKSQYVYAKVLQIGPNGPYVATRKVRNDLPKSRAYTKAKFRGQLVFVSKTNLTEIRRRKTPREPKQPPGVETEEILVRVDYKGGSLKRGKGGASRGRTSRAIVNVRLQVTGTQAQRDRVFEEVSARLMDSMRFLSPSDVRRESALRAGRFPAAFMSEKLKIGQASVSDGKGHRFDFRRTLFADLKGELD